MARAVAVFVVLAGVVAAAVAGAAPQIRALPPLPISGEWLWGTGAEPRRGPVRAWSSCGSYPATVELSERDGVVDSEWHDGRPMAGGAAHAMPPVIESIREKLHGRFDGARLVLDGTRDTLHVRSHVGAADPDPDAAPRDVRLPPDVHERVHVELRFEPRTGHFVGTRNGVAIWLARGTITPGGAAACPP